MFLSLIFVLATADSVLALQARCNMQLHNNGTNIGQVIFTSNGNQQKIEAYLKGDPNKITRGHHGLHIHTHPVKGNDCSVATTGPHYNPEGGEHGGLLSDKISRHLGDLGNVRAGERGEINQINLISVNPGIQGESSWGLIEPVMYCPPEPYMVWLDGKEERIEDLEKAEEMLLSSLERGKREFYIAYKQPDCYQPAWNSFTHIVNHHKFALEGEKSIVGRAIVLQGNRDTWYRDGKEGTEDKAIACCTLDLVNDYEEA